MTKRFIATNEITELSPVSVQLLPDEILLRMKERVEYMESYKAFDVLAIFDSFWASPNNMNEIRQNYLNIMMEIADSNMLKDILDEIEGGDSGFKGVGPSISSKMIDAEYALS